MGARAEPVNGIQPELLKWARDSANMTTAEVAEKLNKRVEEIEEWENGKGGPSYAQLERLAYEIYKRPLAIFFLPSPPDEPRPRTEFRSLPDADLSSLQRHTVLLIRKGHAFQAALDELYRGRNPSERPLWREIALTTQRAISTQAQQVRELLGVSLDQVRAESDDDGALKLWRRAIEARGVFVFKDSFKQGEISGFCLRHDEFPIILINNSTTKTRQIFSLLHELAHLLFNRNGISRFDSVGIDELPPQDRAIERFCNSIAAEILVPSRDFTVAVRELNFDPRRASDEEFAILARRYHVSRSVILRRFLDQGRVTEAFYLEKDQEWADQRGRGGRPGGDYYNTQGAYLSERFLRDVVSGYTRRMITKSEVAEMIGVKPKNFEAFQDLVLRGTHDLRFDTSSFIRLNSYYPDIFPGFWQQFNEAVAAGEIVSTREVLRELEREDPDHVFAWAKQNGSVFTTPTAAETEFVGSILAVPHFQQIIGTKARLMGTPVADPFVIACAAVHGGTVVTEERRKPHSAKIPNVCDHFGIGCVNLEEFMRTIGWTFS
jgi:Zn-dependent peptidase ImmA (M78 family)/transcriptional regulator with XRE-family HTH domain